MNNLGIVFRIAIAAVAAMVVLAIEPPKPQTRIVSVDNRCPKCLEPSAAITNSIHTFSNKFAGHYDMRKWEFKCNRCTNEFRRWEKTDYEKLNPTSR